MASPSVTRVFFSVTGVNAAAPVFRIFKDVQGETDAIHDFE